MIITFSRMSWRVQISSTICSRMRQKQIFHQNHPSIKSPNFPIIASDLALNIKTKIANFVSPINLTATAAPSSCVDRVLIYLASPRQPCSIVTVSIPRARHCTFQRLTERACVFFSTSCCMSIKT